MGGKRTEIKRLNRPGRLAEGDHHTHGTQALQRLGKGIFVGTFPRMRRLVYPGYRLPVAIRVFCDYPQQTEEVTFEHLVRLLATRPVDESSNLFQEEGGAVGAELEVLDRIRRAHLENCERLLAWLAKSWSAWTLSWAGSDRSSYFFLRSWCPLM